MRIVFTPLLLLALSFYSCNRHEVVVEREAKERTRMEAFDGQYDASGRFLYDALNAERAFQRNCAECHSDPSRLTRLVLSNPHQFWQVVNFGDPARKMPAFAEEVPFQDLVDVTGYCMFRKQSPQ